MFFITHSGAAATDLYKGDNRRGRDGGTVWSAVEDGRIHDCIPVFPVAASRATMVIRDLVCVKATGAIGEVVWVLLYDGCAEVVVDVEFWWDTEGAFDALPD